MPPQDQLYWQGMMRDFRSRAILQLAALPVVGIRSFNDHDVDALERSLGFQLPASYRAFMTVMGRSAGSLFGDVAMTFSSIDDILRLQRRAVAAPFEAGGLARIPSNAFFFSDYLDSQFGFFVCRQDDPDPLTYNFEFSNPQLDPPTPYVRFTDLIRGALAEIVSR